ncbi:MAG: LysR family transcriptional regulator, partial [Pseudolabrys sp.]|nr:LysR family transcriptional regulator [Pseudolabrys sp.]
MLTNRLRIQHLETLISIGRHRNAHRAAEELAISQPAVSKIIREVEEIFGTVMFERGRGGMIPNLVGEALIARAIALINDIGRTHDEIDAITAGQVGSLRLGVIAFIAPTLISLSLNRLKAENVSLRLEIHEGTTPRLVEQLLCNE